MIAAIMQPYFFPYIGYFQLMQAVDTFVFHDDAQYIKAGWVNRNRILLDGESIWLTLPVRKGASLLAINQRHYQGDSGGIDTIKRRLRACYAKAPMFDEAYPFLCHLLDYADENVAAFNINLLISLATRLGIACKFEMSSSGEYGDLKGQEKVIGICHRFVADCYINPIGGLALYDGEAFSKQGIHLCFLKANPSHYAQFGAETLSFLSIIDVIMFNPIERVSAMLEDYRLVDPESLLPP